MTRRQFLSSTLGAAVARAAVSSGMGIAGPSFSVFRAKDAIDYLEHCRALGAGGIQTGITSTDPSFLADLRGRAEKYGMYIEAIGGLRGEPERVEAAVKAAKQAGALCMRCAMLGGRRYETFDSLEQWKKFAADSHVVIERAIPIFERHKLPLAVENHKDWTVDEFVEMIRRYGSDKLGVCLDTGNNIALLDDPMEVVERLAPYAHSTHIKDMGVEEYPEGFLLSEVPLGDGLLDLPKIFATLRKHRPAVKFSLEMITRDPLPVPCLTDKYWVTFPERNGRYLARMLTLARQRRGARPLPRVEGLDRAARGRLEEENIKKCLAYSRDKLGV